MANDNTPNSADDSDKRAGEFLRRRKKKKYSGSGPRTAVRAWARDTFSREQLTMSLRSLVIVAPLTVIIWVYAERSTLKTVNNQTIPITVKSSNPKFVVTVTEPADRNITAGMTGPRAAVDHVSDELKLIPQSGEGVPFEIQNTYIPGKSYTIQASDIGNAEIFLKNGVTLNNINPQLLHIEIDEIKERQVDVQPPPDLQNLASAPTFEPRRVTITGPDQQIQTAEANNDLTVVPDLKGFADLKTPGKHELPSVPLKLPDRLKDCTVSPETVKATIEIRQADAKTSITVPIYITYSTTVDEKFRADLPQTSIPNVTIFGPPATIEAIDRGDFEPRPKARLEITNKDALHPGDRLMAKPTFDLPPGVRVSDADLQKTIEYRLVSRTQPE